MLNAFSNTGFLFLDIIDVIGSDSETAHVKRARGHVVTTRVTKRPKHSIYYDCCSRPVRVYVRRRDGEIIILRDNPVTAGGITRSAVFAPTDFIGRRARAYVVAPT